MQICLGALKVCPNEVLSQPLDRSRPAGQNLLSIFHAVDGIKGLLVRVHRYSHFSEPSNAGLLHPFQHSGRDGIVGTFVFPSAVPVK